MIPKNIINRHSAQEFFAHPLLHLVRCQHRATWAESFTGKLQNTCFWWKWLCSLVFGLKRGLVTRILVTLGFGMSLDTNWLMLNASFSNSILNDGSFNKSCRKVETMNTHFHIICMQYAWTEPGFTIYYQFISMQWDLIVSIRILFYLYLFSCKDY